MDLTGLENLISAADVDAFPTTSRKPETIHWGTVVEDGTGDSGLAVQLDGEQGTVFPSDSLTFSRKGDRVQLRIKDTRATVMGTANNAPLADAIAKISDVDKRLNVVNNDFTELINQTRNDLSEAATQWDAARADIQAALAEKNRLDVERDMALQTLYEDLTILNNILTDALSETQDTLYDELTQVQEELDALDTTLASTADQLAQSQTEITRLFQLVNSGQNYLRNTYDLAGWSKSSAVSFGEDSTGAGMFCFPATSSASLSVFPQPNIPFAELRGKTVTFSCYMRAPASSQARMYVYLELVDSETNTGSRVGYKKFAVNSVADGEWYHVHYTLTLNDSIFAMNTGIEVTDDLYLRLRFYQSSTAIRECCVKLVKLELGETATSWSPHPFDYTDSFSALKEQISDTAAQLQRARTQLTSQLNAMNTDVQTALTGGVSVDRLFVSEGAKMSNAVIDNLVTDTAFIDKILSSQIVVEPTEYAPDPAYKPNWWQLSGNARISTTTASPTGKGFYLYDIAANSYARGKRLPVKAGDKLYYSFAAYKRNNDVLGKLQLYASTGKTDGTTGVPAILTINPASITAAKWTTYSGVWTVPDNVKDIQILVGCNQSGDGSGASNYYCVHSLTVKQQTGAVLIQDGAVTADKIQAGAVNASNIAANTISAGQINAESVAGAVGSFLELNASQITAGTLSADHIAANSITTEKMAAGSVTAEKIAANAVTANKIAANAVNAIHIAANSINAADKLTVGATVSGNGVGVYGDGVRIVQSGKGIVLNAQQGLIAGDVSSTSKASLWLDMNGNATFKGNILASTITGGIIDGTTITGGSITASDFYGEYVEDYNTGDNYRCHITKTGFFQYENSAGDIASSIRISNYGSIDLYSNSTNLSYKGIGLLLSLGTNGMRDLCIESSVSHYGEVTGFSPGTIPSGRRMGASGFTGNVKIKDGGYSGVELSFMHGILIRVDKGTTETSIKKVSGGTVWVL